MDGWADGWLGVEAVLRIAYINQKEQILQMSWSLLGFATKFLKIRRFTKLRVLIRSDRFTWKNF